MNSFSIINYLIITLSAIIIPYSDFGLKSEIYVNNRPNILKCEVAKTKFQQEKGLMYRQKIQNMHGMIFAYDKERLLTFWMKNTYIPLYIIYVKENFKIDSIFYMKPLDSSILYYSDSPCKYAIEISPKTYKNLGITINDKLSIDFTLYYNFPGLSKSLVSDTFTLK